MRGDDIWIGQSLGKSTSFEKAEFFLESNSRCFKILSEVLCSINKVETLVVNRETTMMKGRQGLSPKLPESSIRSTVIPMLFDSKVNCVKKLLFVASLFGCFDCHPTQKFCHKHICDLSPCEQDLLPILLAFPAQTREKERCLELDDQFKRKNDVCGDPFPVKSRMNCDSRDL
ncbi:hypothetical protein Prudu_020759 [Prunus dulcis]|uniref:Uncharacterized protein n=1 Tax=Prunus dulcis TaxID=3755 RepID=A0A4Y1RW47_PRUDU|nr:hypothetical protein Prudu_020759 [Prunus dulcis]